MIARPAAPADAEAIHRISLAAGQPATGSGADPRYLEHVMATGTVLVAEAGGAVAGWGAVRDAGPGSLLCDLFVDPAHQGEGIGRDLLAALWPDGSAPARFTFSSAHPHALPLYVKAGLVPRWPLLYLHGPAVPAEAGGMSARRVPSEVAADAEAELTGHHRTADYAYWTAPDAGTGVVVTDGDRLAAAGALATAELAHLACPREADGTGALLAALGAAGAPAIDLCVPGPHPALRELLARGFRVVEQDMAMSSPGLGLPTAHVYSPGLG